MIRPIRFRQAIFKNSKFDSFYYWGLYQYGFVGPMVISGGDQSEVKESEQMFLVPVEGEDKPVEVYEGDLILFSYRDSHGGEMNNEPFEVEYQDKRCGFYPLSNDYGWDERTYEFIKVVGHKWEASCSNGE